MYVNILTHYQWAYRIVVVVVVLLWVKQNLFTHIIMLYLDS